ncbi:methyltransferase family protein [Herbihabitans rhizosphaerae]|uniref:Methyltransferase family protein n=1 Tax=Herbihabitans rhizosphaerae TaxID=1872711 RepID=A0A4Q7KBI7_9PSEU|nr:class I SAM-dependent methyltransferase [Herbihabitans rhizosphaerae]RZS29485.1 methyltransferase family protein [Herbihabitans rhizosphaerae]
MLHDTLRGTARALRPGREQADRIEALEHEVRALREELAISTQRILDRVIEFEIRSRKDIVFAGDQDAAVESNRFARDHLVGVRHFRHPWETLDYGLSLAPTGGMALEFGVATGNTLRAIATQRGGERVYGFDSFQGLPEAWIAGMAAGAFAREDLPEVPGADLVVGLFDDTLAGFLAAHDEPLDFVHVDCDLYSSASTVLEQLAPRLRPGTVLVFDEYFNYPGWQRHEHRAWTEFVERTGIAFEYVAYTYADCQVAVRIN